MYKVLIVDDEPLILEGLPYVINWEEHGAEIAGSAKNGMEALEILEREPIHILISDIKMPVMDGLQLIKEIRKRGIHLKIIILSGFGEFDLVKKASKLGIENYLLKPVEEEELSYTLQNSIEKIQNELHLQIRSRENYNIIKENTFYRWVTNNISNEELMNKADFLNIRLIFDCYMVCLVDILKHSKPADDEFQDRGWLSYAVLNICSETIGDYGNNVIFNSINGDLVILFSWKNEEFDSNFAKELLKNCIENINRHLKTTVFISIGSVENELSSVHKSYRYANMLKGYHLIMPPNTMIDVEEVEKNSLNINHASDIDFMRLKAVITAGDKPRSFLFIDEIYASLEKTEGLTPEYVQGLTMELLFHVFGTFNVPGLLENNKPKHSGHILFEFMNMHKLSTISAWLKSIVEDHMDQLETAREGINPLIKMMLLYIDNHYAQEISLKTLSQSYNVNAAYLGQLFKNATGEMFSNYLNEVRIKKSKELLVSTNLKTSEIAAQVGFSSVNYFSNVFKKFIGVYPGEFRSGDLNANH